VSRQLVWCGDLREEEGSSSKFVVVSNGTGSSNTLAVGSTSCSFVPQLGSCVAAIFYGLGLIDRVSLFGKPYCNRCYFSNLSLYLLLCV